EVAAETCDLRDIAALKAGFARLKDRFGPASVLVNNAAIHFDTWQRVSGADLGVVQEAITTNTLGPWRLSMALLPMLRRSQAPRIVNVSSGGGSIASMSGKTPAYSVSKAGLNAVTRMLARDLEDEGILVNAVCPGWTQTEMGEWGGRTVEDGAAGVVWAATLDPSGPSGGFFQDTQPVPW
ncbi:MAG: SDR family oxidoreductase, partial [Candidatus Tectomicrobia bacterium]|nr:SDR family oxidoreductase [Candidatus Tectomicrobia bacterium]